MNDTARTTARRWRRIAGNTATLLVSLIIGYLFAGSLLLLYGPAVAPQLFNSFPRAATIWWQASAPDPDKQSYIALLGDSYAAGMGDWNVEREQLDQPYYSGDVIAAKLSRHVLSYGKGGASNSDALVLLPTRIMNAGRCLLFSDPLPPEALIVYFYEGNDLRDNIKRMSEDAGIEPGQADYAQAVAARLAELADSAARGQCLGYIIKAVTNLGTGLSRARSQRKVAEDHDTGQAVRVGGQVVLIPEQLQGPALDLDEAQIEAGFEVLDQSLRWLMNRFAHKPVLVVYIPAVLTSYELATDSVILPRIPDALPRARVAEQSNRLCRRLREITLHNGAAFLDTRGALSAAGRNALIHGPRDWKHLNREGQTVLGTVVADAVTGGMKDSGCADLHQ